MFFWLELLGCVYRGQKLRVTLWGSIGDSLIEKKTSQSGLCPVVLASVSAKM